MHVMFQVIYIAPLKALVRERMIDWGKGMCKALGKKIVELTGRHLLKRMSRFWIAVQIEGRVYPTLESQVLHNEPYAFLGADEQLLHKAPSATTTLYTTECTIVAAVVGKFTAVDILCYHQDFLIFSLKYGIFRR